MKKWSNYHVIDFFFFTQYSVFSYIINLKNKSVYINNSNQNTKDISVLDLMTNLIKSLYLVTLTFAKTKIVE